MNRFLLHIRLSNGQTFDKEFKNYQDAKDYIKQRDFYFIHADYTIYDLAIQERA